MTIKEKLIAESRKLTALFAKKGSFKNFWENSLRAAEREYFQKYGYNINKIDPRILKRGSLQFNDYKAIMDFKKWIQKYRGQWKRR